MKIHDSIKHVTFIGKNAVLLQYSCCLEWVKDNHFNRYDEKFFSTTDYCYNIYKSLKYNMLNQFNLIKTNHFQYLNHSQILWTVIPKMFEEKWNHNTTLTLTCDKHCLFFFPKKIFTFFFYTLTKNIVINT